MGFLSGAAGGQNTAHVAPGTDNPDYVKQKFLDDIKRGQTQETETYGNLGGVGSAQGDLAAMLRAQATGQGGPNLGELQLQQATDRTNKQAAGLMGSQRGINPALAQRLVATNAANANQQAAQQSGIMRAQQQIAAQQQLGNVLSQQAGTYGTAGGLAAQNLNTNQNAQTQQNAQISGATTAANETNAKIDQANAAARQQAAGAGLAGLGSAAAFVAPGVGNLLKGLTTPKPAAPVMTDANADLTSAASMLAYSGGQVPAMADGGPVNADEGSGPKIDPDKAAKLRKALGFADGGQAGPNIDPEKAAQLRKALGFADGGQADGMIPGDHPANDIVPAMLSPKEVVLPRSVTMAKDAPDKAKAFMEAIAKHKGEPVEGKPSGFAHVLEAKRALDEAMKHLEKHTKGAKK